MQKKIRLAKIDDIDSIYEIEKISFENPWSKKSIRNAIKEDLLSDILVFEYEKKVIAYISYMIIYDEIHIANVATHPDFQNRKIASQLFKYLVNYAEENDLRITLEVRTNNKYALKLYKSFNFKIEGLRKDYYGIDKDALIMWRDLEGERTI